MKLEHKVNPNWRRPSAAVSDAYEAEVRRSTERGERLYRQAEKRLHQAERRLERVRTAKSAKNRTRQIAELEALVELRRTELDNYRRLMESTAASSEHRGRKSYRPVPTRHGSNL